MNRFLHLIRLRGRLRRPGVQLGVEAAFWILLASCLEFLGRHVPSDWVDLLAGAALLGLIVAAAGPPFGLTLPRQFLRSLRRAGSWLEALFDAHHGADFHPEKPPRLPPLRRYRRVMAVIALVDLVLGTVVLLFGSPLHAVCQISYLLYLVLGALTCIGVAVAITSLTLTLLQQLRRTPTRQGSGRPRSRRRVLALLAALAAGIGVLILLDRWVGAWGWLTAMAFGLLVLVPPRFGPPVEFRLNLRVKRSGEASLETTTVEEMVRSFLGILILTAIALSLIVQGHRLPLAAEVPEMASRFFITHHLGSVLAWVLGAGTLFGTALYLREFTIRRRRSDPAFPGPVATDREEVLRLVQLNLDLARAGRRDRGEGFLFAPHWWPSDRMYRDSWHDEDLSEGSAGPDFHRHYGQPARRLLRRILKALAIDLIYIEDGVPSAQVLVALRLCLRHYDATGGDEGRDQLIEERHLSSPPGLHLALQEIELDLTTRDLGGYKEPSYESLSRARVLLILRVRGGEEEPEDDPFAFTSEPGWVDRFLSRVPVAPVVTAG
jgi:hypothetical protein